MPYVILPYAHASRPLRNLRAYARQLRRRFYCMLGGATMASYGLSAQVAVAQVAVTQVEKTALSFELNEAQQIEPQSPASATAASATGVIRSYAASAGSQTAPPVSVPNSASLTSDTAFETANAADPIPARWWSQGSNSPIAVAIGNAEGTRQPDGAKTAAYYWHRDPGNGADNFGTFSYQHFSAARTQAVRAEATAIAKRETAAAQQLPELADQAQMQRLRGFYQQLQRQAQALGLVLTPLEVLNGLDLINQSEAAGLSAGGYIDHLAQMRSLEESAEEQIKEARAWSYWHPERQNWDAPGLGNSYPYVRRDQERRFEAVKRAAEVYIPNGNAWIAQMPQATSDDLDSPGAIVSQRVQPHAQEHGKKTLRQTVASAVQTDSLSFELGRRMALAAVGR